MCICFAVDITALLQNRHVDFLVTLIQIAQHIPMTYKNARDSIAQKFLNVLLGIEVEISTVKVLISQVDILSQERRTVYGTLSVEQLWKVSNFKS